MKSKASLLVIGLGASLLAYASDKTALDPALLSCSGLVLAEIKAQDPVPDTRRVSTVAKPKVQMAILLDTSGSMSGLIEQAKSQLWKMVNEFSRAKREGQTPELEVALYEYGKSTLESQEGYLRMIQPLSADLDKLSEELFALKTNGGDEYCGWVIRAAVEGLAWSPAPRDFKVIFIAGNEPFTQGPVDYREACQAAVRKGIVVNTVHCGPREQGAASKWEDGAFLAEGTYLHIDHNRAIVHYPAPQDPEIARLNAELNQTYVAFGAAGTRGLERQQAQDKNAYHLAPAVAAERAVTKSSGSYRNDSWDLIDAVRSGVKLGSLAEAVLPAEMKGMTETERKAFVEQKRNQREQIQQKIQQLNTARTRFLAEKSGPATPGTLDAAMITAVREQASKRMYRFE